MRVSAVLPTPSTNDVVEHGQSWSFRARWRKLELNRGSDGGSREKARTCTSQPRDIIMPRANVELQGLFGNSRFYFFLASICWTLETTLFLLDSDWGNLPISTTHSIPHSIVDNRNAQSGKPSLSRRVEIGLSIDHALAPPLDDWENDAASVMNPASSPGQSSQSRR